MLKCSRCGASLPAHSRYCGICGNRLTRNDGDVAWNFSNNDSLWNITSYSSVISTEQAASPDEYKNEPSSVWPETSPREDHFGMSFPSAVGRRSAAPKAPGQPPTAVRKRKYRAFIPGLGAFGLWRRDPQTGQWGCAPGCLISAILTVVLILAGFLLFPQWHPSGSASLAASGPVVPGGPLNIHGSNFPPGSTVGITVDSAPSASMSHSLHDASVLAYVWNLAAQARLVYP